MSDSGNVLPQAEIDAIFKQATGKGIVPKPAAPEKTESASAAPVEAPPGRPEKQEQPAEEPVPSRPASGQESVQPPPARTEPELQHDSPAPGPGPKPESTRVDPPSPSPLPGSQPVAYSPPPPPVADDTLKQIQSVLDRLSERIKKIEADIIKLKYTDEKSTEFEVQFRKLSSKIASQAENARAANRKIDAILRGLNGTPGYGIRKEFTCDSCGSSGFLAIPVKCTKCGNKGWWGWWPEEG